MPAQVAQRPSDSFHWKRGEYHTFYAQMRIRVGGHGGSEPVDIEEGDEFEYDGSVCKYAGREFPQPQLRGAVREGWATLDQAGQRPASFVAVRDVASSQSKTTDLSRVQRRGAHVLESDALDEDTVLEVADRNRSMDKSGRPQAPKIITAKDNRRGGDHKPGTFRGLEVEQSDLDEQDHTVISPIRTKASIKVDILANPGAARQIEESQDAARGAGRYAGVRRQPNVVQREGVTITSNVGDVDRNVRAGDASEGRTVGKVRHTSSGKRSEEGVSIEDTSGDQTGRRPRRAAAPEPAPAPAAKAAPARPAPAAKAAPAPAKLPRLPADASPKLKLAVRLHPSFPIDWNFFAPAGDKISRIKKLGSDPKLLDALYATESPAMKKVLEQKFSSHFVS